MNRLNMDNYSGGRGYLGKDILGSVRGITDDYGQLEERYEYNAFGKPYEGDLTRGMNLGYTGKPYDVAMGMYNYGYRDYAPEVARFTSEDPVRDGANWFAYVNNDPVNWIDLWGLECSASDSAYRRYQETIGIIWHEETDKNSNSPVTYSGAYMATDYEGYMSAGTFSGSLLNFDKIYGGDGAEFKITHSIAGSASVSNTRVVDIIIGEIGTNIIVTRDDRPDTNNNPFRSLPGSMSSTISNDGSPKQDRYYADDGYPDYDIDYDHNHGYGQPHRHNWTRPADGSIPTHQNRLPGIPFD